jgi:hypothetical protein
VLDIRLEEVVSLEERAKDEQKNQAALGAITAGSRLQTAPFDQERVRKIPRV